MSDQRQSQTRRAGSRRKPQWGRDTSSTARDAGDTRSHGLPEPVLEADTDTKQRPGLRLETPTGIPGKAGERNLRIQWIDVWVANHRPMYFKVSTVPGNPMEATVEQRSYRKPYSTTSSLQTEVTPIAPVGTTGKLTVRDIATGETLEQPWVWVLLRNPGLLARLWKALKRSLWKPGS